MFIIQITSLCTVFARLQVISKHKIHSDKKYSSDFKGITTTNAYFQEFEEWNYPNGIKAL